MEPDWEWSSSPDLQGADDTTRHLITTLFPSPSLETWRERGEANRKVCFRSAATPCGYMDNCPNKGLHTKTSFSIHPSIHQIFLFFSSWSIPSPSLPLGAQEETGRYSVQSLCFLKHFSIILFHHIVFNLFYCLSPAPVCDLPKAKGQV